MGLFKVQGVETANDLAGLRADLQYPEDLVDPLRV